MLVRRPSANACIAARRLDRARASSCWACGSERRPSTASRDVWTAVRSSPSACAERCGAMGSAAIPAPGFHRGPARCRCCDVASRIRAGASARSALQVRGQCAGPPDEYAVQFTFVNGCSSPGLGHARRRRTHLPSPPGNGTLGRVLTSLGFAPSHDRSGGSAQVRGNVVMSGVRCPRGPIPDPDGHRS